VLVCITDKASKSGVVPAKIATDEDKIKHNQSLSFE